MISNLRTLLSQVMPFSGNPIEIEDLDHTEELKQFLDSPDSVTNPLTNGVDVHADDIKIYVDQHAW